MKTIQLGVMALFCLSLFSCAKDVDSLASRSSSTTTSTSSPELASRVGGPNGGGPNSGNTTPGNNAIAPDVTVSFSKNPAIEGEAITITAGFADPAAAGPGCGQLHLQQLINGEWVKVAEAEVTSAATQASFIFTPVIVGNDVYSFRVHYIGSGNSCQAYSNSWSLVNTLDVLSACTYSFTGAVDPDPVPADGENMYYFTVRYTVNTCALVFDKLKTQGGLTNGVSDVVSTGGLADSHSQWIPGSSTNQVIRWEENTPGMALPTGKREYVITFKRKWTGGPVTITGNWSAKATWMGTVVGDLEVAPLVYTP